MAKFLGVILIVLVGTYGLDRAIHAMTGAPKPLANLAFDNWLFTISAEDLWDRSYFLGECYTAWSEAVYPKSFNSSALMSLAERARLEKKRDFWMKRRLETMRGLARALEKIQSNLSSRYGGETGSSAAATAGGYFQRGAWRFEASSSYYRSSP